MIVDLEQDCDARPKITMASGIMPTLVTHGTYHNYFLQRPLLAQEHLRVMGVCVFPHMRDKHNESKFHYIMPFWP